MSETSFILTLTSDPLPGIIASVATAIADLGGNITETHQHWDRPTNRFFLRVAFVGPGGLTVAAVERALAPTVEKLGLDLYVVDAERRPIHIIDPAVPNQNDHRQPAEKGICAQLPRELETQLLYQQADRPPSTEPCPNCHDPE